MYFVDTNIFLRFFIREDEKTFKETERVFQLIKSGRLKSFTSHLVIAELDWTMKSYYKIPKDSRLLFLSSILHLQNLKIVDNFDLLAALDFYRDYQIKFIDCLLASHPGIRSGRVGVISYDRDFDKLKIKRIDPATI